MLPAPFTRLKRSGHAKDEQNRLQHCLSSHLLLSHRVVDASGIGFRPREQPKELQYTTCRILSETEKERNEGRE